MAAVEETKPDSALSAEEKTPPPLLPMETQKAEGKSEEAVEPMAMTEEDAAAKKAAKQAEIEEALNCPCIESMKQGPCGEPFIAAYRCFLESESDPKGSECYEQFVAMHTCIQENPDAYSLDDDDDPFDNLEKDGQKASPAAADDGSNSAATGNTSDDTKSTKEKIGSVEATSAGIPVTASSSRET